MQIALSQAGTPQSWPGPRMRLPAVGVAGHFSAIVIPNDQCWGPLRKWRTKGHSQQNRRPGNTPDPVRQFSAVPLGMSERKCAQICAHHQTLRSATECRQTA